MEAWLTTHEPWIRFGSFALLLTMMTMWERVRPRRPKVEPQLRHDARNIAIVVVDVIAVRLLVPLLPAGLALIAAERGWGLFNLVAWPGWLELIIAVMIFDFVIYLQHVMFHAVPALWRLHMVHHVDLDFDATTGLRFHPLEILLSLVVKLGTVLVVGPSAAAVIVFEVLLNGTALFNHGNVSLPAWLDRPLRWLLVTPDMHRVHHSTKVNETNSNFGFNLSWWDRLLGTYRPQPAAGHDDMAIGLETYREPRQLTLGRLLTLPFAGRRGKRGNRN